MSKSRFAVAGLMAIVSLTFAGCGQRDLDYKSVECDELKRDVRDLEQALDDCNKHKMAEYLHTTPNSDNLDVQGAGLGPHTHMGSRDKEVFISIGDEILFKPGSAKLTAEAKATLSRIIELVHEKYAGHHIRVDGFTDNEPITRSKDKWDDNFDLSGGRGLSVLHYLEAHGIASKDLGFAGFGQNRALASNSSESGRAKNRRVEIVVDPDMTSDEPEPEAAPEDSTKPSHHTTHHATHHSTTHSTTHSATSSSTSSASSTHATEPATVAPISGSTNSSSFATPGGSGSNSFSSPSSSPNSFSSTPSGGGTFSSPSASPSTSTAPAASSNSLQAAPATTLTPGPTPGAPATPAAGQ